MSVPDKAIKHVAAHAVFSPVIDEFMVADFANLNLDLIRAIEQWRAEDKGIVRSNVEGWHSDASIFKRTEAPIVKICKHFISACQPALRRYVSKELLASRKQKVEGWANVNPSHTYNQLHTHDRYDFSGVYYVQVPERSHRNSGLLQFINPSYRGGPYSDVFKAMNPQTFSIDPAEGKMVIFPSAMPHWVLPNDERVDRISLAFNLGLV